MAPSHLISVLGCCLILVWHADGFHGFDSADALHHHGTQADIDAEYCITPADTCGNGGCTTPMYLGLYSIADFKTAVGEATVWRHKRFLYITLQATAPYKIRAHAANHLRLYIGSHLPAGAEAQYLDAFSPIGQPVGCASVAMNLDSICLPACVYHAPSDRCVCAPPPSQGAAARRRVHQPPTSDNLFRRASLYLSLQLQLLPMPSSSSPLPSSAPAVPVTATMHSINWTQIAQPSCMPTAQLHQWGAVVEWRNPDRPTHVPLSIAEFHQRQGPLHRHVPHFKVVPGVSARSILRSGVRRFLWETMMAAADGDSAGRPLTRGNEEEEERKGMGV